MLKSVITASLVSLSVFATAANANPLISYKEIAGVVTGVDAAARTISVTTKEGASKTFNVSESAKVVTAKGTKLNLSLLSKGDTVVLKQRIDVVATNNLKDNVI
jgi:hypothetical protein